MKLRNLPTRLATGAYVLHTGITKWRGGPEQAAGVHQMASNAYPVLATIKAPTFLKAVSVAEITTGSLLLAPLVSNRFAGLALSGFAGGLVGMYLRTPAMRQPGSIWPTQQGTAVSKDVWLLGIGLGLLADRAARK